MVESNLSIFDSVVIKGSKYFYGHSGKQFFIKGATYLTPAPVAGDPLGEGNKYHHCEWDASPPGIGMPAPLVNLGLNVIHVRVTEHTQDHTRCMNLLQEIGIYVIVNLEIGPYYIDFEKPSWNEELYEGFTKGIDTLAPFPNVLGFTVLDESRVYRGYYDDKYPQAGLAVAKAATRDMKAYIKKANYREFPIGIILQDESDDIGDGVAATYMSCGDTTAGLIDFLGLWNPKWCDDRPFDKLITGYTAYRTLGIPIFISDYGCKQNTTREFKEIATLYGPKMADSWSGGVVYEWLQQGGYNGLYDWGVDDSTINTLAKKGSVSPDGVNFRAAIIDSSPVSVEMSAYTPISSTITCPQSAEWTISPSLPPIAGSGICGCMARSLSCFISRSTPLESIDGLHAQLCSEDDTACLGTRSEFTQGNHGAFSICDPYQKISWSINRVHLTQMETGNDTTCSNAAYANTQTPDLSTSCSLLLSAAGVFGNQTVGPELSTPTATRPATQSTTLLPTTSSSPTNSSSVSNTKLSRGTIAGVAIGATAVAALLIACVFFYRKRTSRKRQRMSNPPGYEHVNRSELMSEALNPELPGETKPPELPAVVPEPTTSSVPKLLIPLTPLTEANITELNNASDPKINTQSEQLRPQINQNRNAALSASAVSVLSEDPPDRSFSPSWANSAWFDTNDTRVVLSDLSEVEGPKKGSI